MALVLRQRIEYEFVFSEHHCENPFQDSTQQTMLTTWLVELFLNDLGALKDEGDREGHAKMTQEFHLFLEKINLRVRWYIMSYTSISHASWCVIDGLSVTAAH